MSEKEILDIPLHIRRPDMRDDINAMLNAINVMDAQSTIITKLEKENTDIKAKLERVEAEALGYAWTYACTLVDQGIDIRQWEVPKLIEDYKQALQESES